MNTKNTDTKSDINPACAAAGPIDSRLASIVLSAGAHSSREDGMCVNEAVAWYANEEHSWRPACECWLLGTVALTLNDTMTNDERQQLVPLIPRLAGSKSDIEVGIKRAFVFVDALVRQTMPMIWELLGMKDEAAELRALEVIESEITAGRSHAVISRIYENSPILRDLRDLRDLRALRDLSDLRDLRALRDLSDLRALRDLSDLRALRALSDLSALSDLRALRALDNPEFMAGLRRKMIEIAINALNAALEIK